MLQLGFHCWGCAAVPADAGRGGGLGSGLGFSSPNLILCAAQFLLTPGVVAARCLALKTNPKGGGAFVELDLRTPIEPLSLTYEHAPVRLLNHPAAPPSQLLGSRCTAA